MNSVKEMSLCLVYIVKRVDKIGVAKTPKLLVMLRRTHLDEDDIDHVGWEGTIDNCTIHVAVSL